MGLVGFQLYWINSVINLNDQRFVNNVHQSLNNVVANLEKRENMFFISRGVSKAYFGSPLKFQGDSTSNMELIIHSDTTHDVTVSRKEMFAFKSRMSNDTGFRVKVKEELARMENAEPDTLKQVGMIQVILDEMVNRPTQVKHRINKEILDTLLHQEFANNGIHLSFEYGVLNPVSDELIISNTQNHNNLLTTDLKATLFPNDILSTPNYLTVNFPGKNSYLFKQIWVTLASSLVLLLIIVGCFAFALLTIIRLKKLSEMKNDFINNMTHEFKTPIATVSLACEALGEPEVLRKPDMYKKYLGIIRDENDRLEGQVERVLQMASMENERLELNYERINLIEVLQAAIDQIQIQVEEKGGNLSLNYSQEEIWIKGDAEHLFSSFVNLLDNANKYSPSEPEIRVIASQQNDRVKIEISDNGIGMSKESIRKIFDKFYRVSMGNVHDVKGFGLGLNYVKSVIEAHGGIISVQSELNRGSTFIIEL